MASIQIRPAVAADAAVIADLIYQLAVYEKLAHKVVSNTDKIAQTLFGAKPFAECLLAVLPADADQASPEKIIGFALFFHNYSTFLAKPGVWLEDLFVLPEHRAVGAGKALLQALGALAVERGCGRFEWAVLDWNTSAIAFYEHMGATVLQDWRIVRVDGDALQAYAR